MPVSSLHLIGAVLVGSGWLTTFCSKDVVLQNDTRSDPNPPTLPQAATFNLSSHVGTASAFDHQVRGFSEVGGGGEWLTCPITGPCTCPCSSMPLASEVVNLNLTAKCEPEDSLLVWQQRMVWKQRILRLAADPVATELSALAKFKRSIHLWCSAIAVVLVWVLGIFTLGILIAMVSSQFFRWGRLATWTLAYTFAAALTALAQTTTFDTSLAAALPTSLASALFAILGTFPLTLPNVVTPAPQTVWPPALHVESIPLSAPVPPAFICPITMAPMANPAMTPRGTSYEREALCDWIRQQHRYPGGEVRAAPPRKRTHPQRPR